MKVKTFEKFILNEGSEFGQYQFGIEPNTLGGSYGWAVDNSLSIYGQEDSPYNNNYFKKALMVNKLMQINKNLFAQGVLNIKADSFMEDLEEFKDLKILRIVQNTSLYLDVYISFVFHEQEFFGVYKNFNNIQKQKLKTDLFENPEFKYIDNTYKLKLDNYFYKILLNWFKPKKAEYIALKDVKVKDNMGQVKQIPKNSTIKVISSNIDYNDDYIEIKFKDQLYYITKNDYYWFNYWFERKKR